MRTFAFAQLLAATLAVNLNISAYDDGLDNIDLETELQTVTDEQLLADLEQLELDGNKVEKLIKEADWKDVKEVVKKVED